MFLPRNQVYIYIFLKKGIYTYKKSGMTPWSGGPPEVLHVCDQEGLAHETAHLGEVERFGAVESAECAEEAEAYWD